MIRFRWEYGEALREQRKMKAGCECGYCKEGMSKSAEECVERRIEVTKRLKESTKGTDWKQVFKNMYHMEEK